MLDLPTMIRMARTNVIVSHLLPGRLSHLHADRHHTHLNLLTTYDSIYTSATVQQACIRPAPRLVVRDTHSYTPWTCVRDAPHVHTPTRYNAFTTRPCRSYSADTQTLTPGTPP
jgi:hypothetical protein